LTTYTAQWETLPALTSYLTTALNSLANNGLVIGAAIDVDNEMWMNVELNLAAQGSARSAGAYVAIYGVRAVDGGTNYGYGSASLAPGAHTLLCALPLDAATTARIVNALVFIPACTDMMLIVENKTGQAFAASATTLSYGFVSEQVVG